MKHRIAVITIFCSTLFLVGLTLAYASQTSAQAAPASKPASADLAEPDGEGALLAPDAAGNLSVSKYSFSEWTGAAPGSPISYTVWYAWSGDGPATNVRVTDQLPPQVTISETNPPPTSHNGNTLVWQMETLPNYAFDTIVITGFIKPDAPQGTVITNTVSIAGDVTDQDPTDDLAEVPVEIMKAQPDLWLFKWGLLEELEEGLFFTAEQGVETSFEIYYFNLAGFAAPDVTLTDQLPSGVEYVSAAPAPSDVSAGQITWDLGSVPAWEFGEVSIQVRPTQTGTLTNTAWITSTAGDRNPEDNSDEFKFDVVTLLPPRLLKPDLQHLGSDQPLIVDPNPTFEGLAKAGATVTLYEGSGDGCYGDFSGCNPVALVSTTAASDRRWTFTPTTLTETKTYSLYLRAELGGQASEPPYGFWSPMAMRVDPLFQQAGWDMDNFVIETENQENRPGGLGGTTGTTPNEPFTITIRQNIWPSVPTSPTLRAYHDLRLVVNGSEVITLPVSEFRPVPTTTLQTDSPAGDMSDLVAKLGYWAYDLFYVQHGFGAGAHVEVWCRPVYYPDDPNEIPIVGLVWTLCNEILVDPAGYVYDVNTTDYTVDWPEVPPDEALITNATVTATVRTGDTSWARWEAEKTGQVNPQITDHTTKDGIKVPGYYAFYVPSGQYRVLASAPGCVPYTSPILTVIDEPIFHNVGMRCSSSAQIGVSYDLFLPVMLR
jgi:uncharacterized repeat protein (TIGR01451 family)